MRISLATPLRKLGIFPRTVVQMIDVGEETGRLDEMLLRVAEIEERHMRARTKTLISLLAPLLIVVVGSLIGFMVIAILLPIAAVAGPDRRDSNLRPGQGAPPRNAADPMFGQCSPHHQHLLQLQIEALKRLKRLAGDEGERLCAALEAADQRPIASLLDPKSLDLGKVDVAKLMRLLGLDPQPLDLRRLREGCRRSRDGLDRFVSEELARLEPEILRCDDRV